jgi:hypothetical protein
MSRATFAIGAVAITALAAVLRFWALDLGLPHLMARPDDEAILRMTGRVAQGHLDLDWAVYPSAWVYLCWAWGVVALHAGEGLGLLPQSSGYADVLARHPERLLLLERAMSATLGTVTVAMLMALARPAIGRVGAVVAGLLLATSFLHARDAHSIKPDVALAFGVVVTLAACVPLAAHATRRRAMRAGSALGVATALKYPGVLLAMPVWLAAVLGTTGRPWWRRLLPSAAVVAGATSALVFRGTSPFLLVNERTRDFLTGVAQLVLPGLFGLPAGATPVPGVEVGTGAAPAYAYHLAFSLRWGSGVMAALAAPVAVGLGVTERRPLLRLSAIFALFYYAVVGLSPVRLARYMTPLLPVLALLTASLLVRACARLDGRRRTVVLMLGTALLIAEPLRASIAHNRIAAREDTRNLATAWLADHVAPGGVVAVAGTRFWGWGQPRMPRGVRRVQVEPTREELLRERPVFVLTHDHVLFSSTVDPAALDRVASMLRPVADFDPFRGPSERAVFEAEDAYYVPIGRFAAVARPGPHIRIYEVLLPEKAP